MAINYLVGKPGNGKTYGVLKRVILPALKEGRSVWTQIEGLYHDKIAEYLELPLEDVQKRLIVGTKKDPYLENFWYDEEAQEAENEAAEAEGRDPVLLNIVQPGFCVVIDEANRYLGTLAQPYNPRRPPADKYSAVIWPVFEVFCREHRHYINKQGQSTDVWFLSQGFKDIKNTYHGVIDMTVLTTKLDFMDRPKEFKMFYFNGAVNPHARRGGVEKSYFRCEPGGGAGEHFDPEIGALYHSHRGGGGKESNTDANKSFWGQKVFFNLLTLRQAKWAAMGLAVVGMVTAGFFMYRVFDKAKHPAAINPIPMGASAGGAVPLGASGVQAQPFNGGAAAQQPASNPVPAYARDEDSTLTLVGFEEYGDKVKIAVLLDKSSRYRYVTDFQFVDQGPASYILYEGKKVSRWTGPGLITTKKVETK